MADGSSPVKRKSLLARGVHRIGKRVLRRGSSTRLDNDLVPRSSPTPASPLPSSPAYATESPTSRQLAARQHLREHFKSEAKAKNVFCHTFATSRSLGFTICVARFGADGRYFVQVDATMVGMPARSKICARVRRERSGKGLSGDLPSRRRGLEVRGRAFPRGAVVVERSSIRGRDGTLPPPRAWTRDEPP